MAERIDGAKANTTHAAEFVRTLPAELTLREMHEKVKAAGHGISHARVYQIRRDEKLGFKYMTEVPPEPKPKTVSALDFVRGLSAELTVREMQQAMKAAGHELTDARVYQIRRKYKLGYKDAPKLGRPRPKTKKKFTAKQALEAIPVPARLGPDPRAQLRRLAFQIGIDRLEAHLIELKRELGI